MPDDVPHLAFPVRLAGGQLATVEQDTIDEIAQGVYWLASTEPGTVDDLPDAGVPSPVFVRGTPIDALAERLREQEPRARIVDVHIDDDHVSLDVTAA
ncbi:MAG: hypothetical protein M0P31_13720 [Solirubrobacteraceae bacterium]|nr:hypothetical protein [Solirubrobacteraceae bacterium]